MHTETSNTPLAPSSLTVAAYEAHYNTHRIACPMDGDALPRRAARNKRNEAMAAHPSGGVQ